MVDINKADRRESIPEKAEIREETNGEIKVNESRGARANNGSLMGEVYDKATHKKDFISLQENGEGFNFPEVEVEGEWSNFKEDVAQQVGRFSDQVLMGSPAAETEDFDIGRDGIKDIAKAADARLKEKMKDK
ncbi:hypothetical protein U472_02110 [Orenia metallireducens]|uniref:Uncharacterized protein n=1 Tax=Orenia metallireducens TaxID=1413210 RepID=A0A1C0ACC8_9FIRM|nr:hypothetical protein [Orenia metallireducens]OCL28016.1 hypothetical protein U472_02110 [Orenia metallireducens]